jgi:hypothetical protein
MEGRRRKAEDVDRAIDLVVREMMEVEPRADLRARVIERIEHPGAFVGRVFRPGFRLTWMMASIAAAAVLAVAVVLWQAAKPIPSRPVTEVVVHPSDMRRPPIIPRPQEPRRTLVRTATPEDRRVTAAVATTDDTKFSSAPPPGFAVIDALAPPPPIVIEQIAPADPPVVAGLAIAPLPLPALEVNALTDSPRERHN